MGRTLKYRGKRSIMFNIMSTPNTAPLMTLEIMNPYLRQMAQFKARNVRSLNEGRGEANVGGGGGLRVLSWHSPGWDETKGLRAEWLDKEGEGREVKSSR